ncbi:hypothetical protein ACWOE3_11275 [Enterococcus dispar]|uniref:Uncharacterized protein n=1 Tax=Enterococcus dispar ATCC 51266 TaxID=1139219 RepID=S1NIK3_9ENTE|nr:hypothetical protein [Enterococcus dispar]EOT43775.1 hypothetical protein OMK_00333 [Enterococcus dispar ATCC 51266]EOW85553.1 hypothetical protein I569_00866 [Enterococcus dispar ATCC 51266]
MTKHKCSMLMLFTVIVATVIALFAWMGSISLSVTLSVIAVIAALIVSALIGYRMHIVDVEKGIY